MTNRSWSNRILSLELEVGKIYVKMKTTFFFYLFDKASVLMIPPLSEIFWKLYPVTKLNPDTVDKRLMKIVEM